MICNSQYAGILQPHRDDHDEDSRSLAAGHGPIHEFCASNGSPESTATISTSTADTVPATAATALTTIRAK